MPKDIIRDDFYPGTSLHRNLRRSPDSLIRLHESLLKTNGYATSKKNIGAVLAASRALYAFLSTEDKTDVNEYLVETKGQRPIRGAGVVQFDLVIQIISALMKYCSDHPGEAIQSAAALAYLEERFEKKTGGIIRRVVRKVWARRNASSPRTQIARLTRLTKGRRSKRARAASPSVATRDKKKTYRQMKLG